MDATYWKARVDHQVVSRAVTLLCLSVAVPLVQHDERQVSEPGYLTEAL